MGTSSFLSFPRVLALVIAFVLYVSYKSSNDILSFLVVSSTPFRMDHKVGIDNNDDDDNDDNVQEASSRSSNKQQDNDNNNHTKNLRPTEPEQSKKSQSTPPPPNARQRVFVRYESSKWEKMWLETLSPSNKDDNNNDQQDGVIHNHNGTKVSLSDLLRQQKFCPFLLEQQEYIHRFLEATCTSFLSPDHPSHKDMCVVDDFYRPIYYNRTSGLTSMKPPKGIAEKEFRPDRNQSSSSSSSLTDASVFSRFVYHDETTDTTYYEYIEPLVAYLRHPLVGCEFAYPPGAYFYPQRHTEKTGCFGYLRTSRTHLLVPTDLRRRRRVFDRFLYFDAGASWWGNGKGGSSLSYFDKVWQRHGQTWDAMYAYESETNSSTFYRSVPPSKRARVHYHHGPVRSHANPTTTTMSSESNDSSQEQPFLPHVIWNLSQVDDYVLFKLDIDSPGVEEANVQFLLDPANRHVLERIDAFYYEFHESRQYGLDYWYKVFWKLRQAGVHAHSWI